MDQVKLRMWRKQNGMPEPKKDDGEKSENESKNGGERKVGEKSASRGSSSKAVDMEHKKKIFKKM